MITLATLRSFPARAARDLTQRFANPKPWMHYTWLLIFSLLVTVSIMYLVNQVNLVTDVGYWVMFVVLFGIFYYSFWERYEDQVPQQTPAPVATPVAATPVLQPTTATISEPPLPKQSRWTNLKERIKKFICKPRYFNPITWQAFRVISSAVFSLVITGVSYLFVWLFSWYFGYATTVPTIFWFGTFILIAFALGLIENGPVEKVPETKYLALVTLWGIPLPIFRTTGDYPWIGSSMGFGRSTKVTKHSEGHQPDFTDTAGFILGGDIPFVVWNNANSSDENRTTIEANAKNDAVVKATLVLILRFFNPRPALDSEDPALDIGNRARQEIREMFRAFVDTDIPSLLDAVGPVLTGNTLLTYFLPRPVGVHKQGSMIKTSGENSIFYVLTDDEQKELDGLTSEDAKLAKLEKYKQKVRTMIQRDAHPETKKRFWPEEGTVPDDLNIDVVRVKNPIREVIEELGLKLRRATIGSITLSPEVTAAAQKASAESHERAAQVASAKANKEARHAMAPTPEEMENPAWRDAMMIAAAGDNPEAVKIIHVPGLEALGALAKAFIPTDKKGGD